MFLAQRVEAYLSYPPDQLRRGTSGSLPHPCPQASVCTPVCCSQVEASAIRWVQLLFLWGDGGARGRPHSTEASSLPEVGKYALSTSV